MSKQKTITKWMVLMALVFACQFFCDAQQPFTDVTVEAGIVDPNDSSEPFCHIAEEYQSSMNFGSGAAWVDYDKDGHLDLYITNREAANCMYHNDGDGTFTEVAASLGIQDILGDGSGVAFADYNNDGWNDFYLCNGYGDRLFRNENGTSFTDVTTIAGFDPNDERRTTSASWGDYDNDGFLDLYISRHVPIFDADPSANSQDQLFHNNGDGTFTDVSDFFVTDDLLGAGFIGGWTDFDHDGDPDIILINDCPLGEGNKYTHVFRNDGGTDGVDDWTFTEVAAAVGIDDCRHGMGIAVGDYNRDGWMDIYYSNIGECVFFENNNGIFSDVTDDLGVGDQGVSDFSWGTSFLDHNNNGWLDLFLVSGALLDSTSNGYSTPNYFYENNGDGTYSDISETVEMGDTTRGRNGPCGDYDNDGDLDIFILNYNECVNLRKNNNDSGYHWVKIELQGTTSNRNGIGSKIKLTTPDDVIQYFETRSGSNLGGGDALYAHFGLKDNTTISEIEVTWPSGTVQTETDYGVDQVINLLEIDPPLPVELYWFSATLKEKNVLLSWMTASELNNDYFVVQRSTDGRTFKNIGKIDGKGTNAQSSNYQFTDFDPKQGDNYYRLKQVDFDGGSSFSPVEHVRFESKASFVKITPNPVTGDFFEVQVPDVEEGIITLYDVFGKKILDQAIERSDRNNISIVGLSNGIYFLSIRNDRMDQTAKVVVNH